MSQFKKLNERKLEKILTLYKARWTMPAIAEKLGVSKTNISYHLKRMDVKTRSRDSYFELPKPKRKKAR